MEALRGIPYYAGDLADYVERRSAERHVKVLAIPVETMRAAAQRIEELSAIVSQNALTADDLPTAGWGIPAGPGFVTQESENDDEDNETAVH
jgi:hypothetical protein